MANVLMPPEPTDDFPAWLEAQGVNEEVARAMDSELGIRDYGVLRACVGDGLVRAELLAAARDRLPFGFYAVLRQVVKALRGDGHHHDDAAASYPGDVTLGGLVDALLALLGGLNRELLQCVRRLGELDLLKFADAGSGDAGSGDDAAAAEEEEMADEMEHRGKAGEPPPSPPSPPRVDTFGSSALEVHTIKTETCPEEVSGLTLETPPGVSGRSQWGEGMGPEESASTHGQSTTGRLPPVVIDATGSTAAGSSRPGGVAEPVSATAEPVPFPPWLRQETAGDETAARESSRLADGGDADATAPCPRGRELPPPPPAIHRRRLSIGEGGLYEPRPRGRRETAGVGGEADASPRRATGDGDKPYRCKVCGCGFAQYATLKRHLHKHNGERPYCCSACGRGFPEPSQLRAHEDAHRRDKPHRCRVCGQAFARSCHLTRHQRTHTGEKPYRCGACGHAFAQSCDLKTHQRTHTGEKPYRCGACGRGFAQGAHLKRHQRTHSSRKPYRCRPCGQIFLDFGSFNAHQLTHMQNVAVMAAAATDDVFATDGNGVP
ncbi:uncharacterized protein LOC144717280 isoform X2 [Lampetra planeri]